MTMYKLTETETLEQYRVSLTNSEIQKEIAAAMAELGYDTEKIAKGKVLLKETMSVYNFNKQEDDETSVAASNYKKQKQVVTAIYKSHSKKARVVFRNDYEILKRLEIEKNPPRTYAKWIECIKKFYSELTKSDALQAKLLRLKLTLADLEDANKKITKLDGVRAEYIREKGESQEATQDKNAAFEKMDDWMYEFYAVAKIALEDNAQLLESLGILVRN